MHEELNPDMEKIVQDHERRISNLEIQHQEIRSEIKEIQGSQYKIENTVLNESKEQKQLLNKLIDHHLATNKLKLNNKWKFLITLVGGGGIFYVVFEIIKFFIEGGA